MRKRQPLTLQQLDMIINACENQRDKALIAWLYVTAARVSEIVRVFKKSDLKIVDDYVAATVKTEKNRKLPFRVLYLPTHDKYVTLALNYILSVSDNQPVWNYSRQYVHKLFKLLGYRVGIKLHPHLLRHTRLTHLVLMANLNEFELIKWAGWSDIKPAKNYVALNNKDILPKLKAAAIT